MTRKKKQGAVYGLRPGSRTGGLKADVVAAELSRIASERGGLDAAVVVDEARPKGSPLHPAFEWNDSVAAEEHRKMQARTLIRSVVVVRGDNESTPAFVRVKTEEAADYQPIETVIGSPSMFASALTLLTAKLSSAEAAMRQLQEAAKGLDDDDRLARIGVAARAVEVASSAVKALH